MNKLKLFLSEKHPLFYSFIRKAYKYITIRFHYLEEYLLGSERKWATRHLRKKEREHNDWGKESNDWIKGYRDSQDHPHRSFLVERISRFSPESILEIGCNCGPNLYLLAKKFPKAEIMGIDVNPVAIQMGNEWFAEQGISNVNLLEGRADELGQFKDKSFDIVFTYSVLMYIRPNKIEKVIKEMIRITRKGLILVEWHSFTPDRNDPSGRGVYYYGYWKRDYVALLKNFIKEEQIKIMKISEDIWPDKNWSTVGAVIEVVF